MLNQSQGKYYVTSATPLVLADVKVLSSNPIHGKVYSIQHYVIKFISDLRQVSNFFPGIPISSTKKTDDIT